MRIRLIKRKSIADFALDNAGSRRSFRIWLTLLKNADWHAPADITATFGSADLSGNGTNRVVFNIKGNQYRLVVRINYDYGLVWIRFIGTHEQYNSINANKI